MYKRTSKFLQGTPHTAVGRDESLVPAHGRKNSPKYQETIEYLVENSARVGAESYIQSMSDWLLARLIVVLCTETAEPNQWLYSVCVEVDDRLARLGPRIGLSAYERNVAETVIPELIQRVRNARQFL